MKPLFGPFLFLICLTSIINGSFAQVISPARGLKISANQRYFIEQNGAPFFWLGDTGWLLFSKLNREEAERYLEDRRAKGFNVIQAMILHSLEAVNVYGDSALLNRRVSGPRIETGADASKKSEYDYWDHIDYIVNLAARKGIYMALVPVWGSNVKRGAVPEADAAAYAKFLALRYRSKPNIIWLNGGDLKGSDSTRIWNTIGSTLKKYDGRHLITFHPFGRTQSSTWFHDQSWLSFNMFQSGHRDYAQDSAKADKKYGEDNWRYVNDDYKLRPIKPTLDGEPSYEGIPHGLHDTLQAKWAARDLRRYAYWSVFAGAAGFTYGNNSVMQMLQRTDETTAYGARKPWYEAIDDPGARHMIHLKKLMLSQQYLVRMPDQSMLLNNTGERYDYLIATRGNDYAFIYAANGQKITLRMGKIAGSFVKASWYDPRQGTNRPMGKFSNKGTATFHPPTSGDDWVLVLNSIKK